MRHNAKTIPNESLVLDAAIKLKAKGMSWRRVAAALDAGVGAEWFKRRLVSGYAANKNHVNRFKYSDERPTASDLERALASIPKDTRDLTGRVFGDPLPGRSALDKKRAAEARA